MNPLPKSDNFSENHVSGNRVFHPYKAGQPCLMGYRALPGALPGPVQAAICCESDKQVALGRPRVQFGSSPAGVGGPSVRKIAQNKENGLNG